MFPKPRRLRFQDLKISLRSQDFCGISRFHRDLKISHRFRDLTEISLRFRKISIRFQISRSQDFIEISGFLWDFKISHRFQDLTKISQDLTEISQDRSHSDLSKVSQDLLINFYGNNRKKYCLGFRISDFKQDFSTCAQYFTLLRTPLYKQSYISIN